MNKHNKCNYLLTKEEIMFNITQAEQENNISKIMKMTLPCEGISFCMDMNYYRKWKICFT